MNKKFNRPTVIAAGFAIAASLLLSSCATLWAPDSVGYVADADAGQVRLCFSSGAAPSSSQEVYLMSKYRQTYKSLRNIATARVTAVGADGCAMATVLDGHPKRDDEVHLSRMDHGH